MTLGAILMLGGAGGAMAEDVSSLWAGAVSGFDGVLPSMPQNWSDLPFTVSAEQAVSYNTNIFNRPENETFLINGNAIPLTPVGSFVDQTTMSASTKFYVGPQQFFADGTYGVYRYVDHGNLNTNRNSADLGVNWVLTSRCNGKLVLATSAAPALPGEQLGVNTVNTVTSESFNETGTCTISGNWSGIFNTGVTRSSNSAPADEVNDFQNAFASAGVRYAVTETDSLQLLATVSHYAFPNRAEALAALDASALADNLGSDAILQKQANLSYTKDFGPNLSVVASIGASTSSGVTNSGSKIEPQFSLSTTWRPTAKLSFNFSASRVVTPPTQVAAALQTNQSVSAGMNYLLTPKLTFNAGVRYSQYSSALGTETNSTLTNVFPGLAGGRTYSASGGLNYTMTPFLNANLSYQYVRSVQTDLTTPISIVMLALSYSPH